MATTKKRRRGHDRGQVLVDLAVMIAGDGESISDLATLRDQPELFGEVASKPTAWRALGAVDGTAQERIASARPRAAVWAAGGFDSFFCIPGMDGAHEKGGVEGEVGRFRRRNLVPVPSPKSR